ncbi:MAG: hypothetical protein OFPII_20360 [Osedax symbiont Rs1]|nr:MAG: hypothetical protein OFPII_20360 [Osedax symbiont Rs1]
MDFTEIYNNTLMDINRWLSEDSSSALIEYTWLLSGITIVLLLGLWSLHRAISKSSQQTFMQQLKIKVDQEESLISGFLQALQLESIINFERYQQNIGILLENITENEALLLNCSIDSESALIYRSNTHLLAKLKNSALRLQVVKAHTLFNALQIALKHHQKQYYQFLELDNKAKISDKPIELNRAQQEFNRLKLQAKQLQKDHLLMMTQMQQMINMLRVYRVAKK